MDVDLVPCFFVKFSPGILGENYSAVGVENIRMYGDDKIVMGKY